MNSLRLAKASNLSLDHTAFYYNPRSLCINTLQGKGPYWELLNTSFVIYTEIVYLCKWLDIVDFFILVLLIITLHSWAAFSSSLVCIPQGSCTTIPYIINPFYCPYSLFFLPCEYWGVSKRCFWIKRILRNFYPSL